MNIWLLIICWSGVLVCLTGTAHWMTKAHYLRESARMRIQHQNAMIELRNYRAPDLYGFSAGSAHEWRKACIEAQQQTIAARREKVRVMVQRDEYRVDADKWKQVHAMWLRMKLTGDGAADFGELMGILANDAEEDELIDG